MRVCFLHFIGYIKNLNSVATSDKKDGNALATNIGGNISKLLSSSLTGYYGLILNAN